MNFDLGWIFEVFLAAAKFVSVTAWMYFWFMFTIYIIGVVLAFAKG